MFKHVIFKSYLSPGDILMLTAAVREFKNHYREKVNIQVDTSCDQIWQNNPYLSNFEFKQAGKYILPNDTIILDASYTEAINKSSVRPYHFIDGYIQFLNTKLNLNLRCTKFSGDVFLSKEEETDNFLKKVADVEKPYWIINAGGKYDYTRKWWPTENYQKVVNALKDKITFVQVGEKGHWHVPLENTINMIGRTTLRSFFQLMHRAVGVITPVSFPMHAAAAVKSSYGLLKRPCVVIAGGGESVNWEQYDGHQFLHRVGTMKCCATGGCWKSRVVPIEPLNDKKNTSLCLYPIKVDNGMSFAKCMLDITPDEVIAAVEKYYVGGILSYE